MRSLSIFGIILFAAVGTNAMSMEKTHNKQQKFLRADASVQQQQQQRVVSTTLHYLAGEFGAGMKDPTGNDAAEIKLVAKVGVTIALDYDKDAPASPATPTSPAGPAGAGVKYAVKVSGYASIGLECTVCNTHGKAQLSYAIEVEMPLPDAVGSTCPKSWVAYVLAYMVEDYVQAVVAATTNTWWSGAANFAARITNWGYHAEVQKLMVQWGCKNHKLTYTSKVKTGLGTPDTSVLQLMFDDSAEGSGVANIAVTPPQCKIGAIAGFNIKGVAVKPLGDFLKATFKIKTPTTGTGLPQVSFKFQLRVISKSKPPKPEKKLVGGAIKPMEDAFFNFFKSWGEAPPANDEATNQYLTALQGFLQGADKMFDATVAAKIPFLKHIVDGLKGYTGEVAKTVQAGAGPVKASATTATKERIGMDFSCKFAYDKTKVPAAPTKGGAYPLHDAFQKLDLETCKVAFVISIQDKYECSVQVGAQVFTFKGVMGAEESVNMEY